MTSCARAFSPQNATCRHWPQAKSFLGAAPQLLHVFSCGTRGDISDSSAVIPATPAEVEGA
eukprot:31465-Eustigmatos_ZCMA.PRE.1